MTPAYREFFLKKNLWNKYEEKGKIKGDNYQDNRICRNTKI